MILILPTKFRVNWPYGSGEEIKNRFSRWYKDGHLGFPIGMILSIFDLKDAPIVSMKFRVRKKNFKNDFRDGGHFRFSIDICYFGRESPRQLPCEV